MHLRYRVVGLGTVTGMLLKTARGLENAVNDLAGSALAHRGWAPTVLAYTGYGSTTWVRILGRVVMGRPEDKRRALSLMRGWRNFVTIPTSGVTVTIKVGDVETTVTTDETGLIDEVVNVKLTPGWHEAVLMVPYTPPVRAQLHVIGPEPQTALLSDIDDTVLVTSLPRPMIAAWNTFVLNEHARRPVPGMAVLYERIMKHYNTPPMFYLSTGAWNVASTLTRFLSRNMYPAGPLLLTDWGPMEDRWFRSGAEHKRRSLDRLAGELPQLSWVMVGDDGQHDPEIYGDFARKFPGIVKGVAIRKLSPTEQVLASGSPVGRPSGLQPDGVAWVSAPHGAGLATACEQVGLL